MTNRPTLAELRQQAKQAAAEAARLKKQAREMAQQEREAKAHATEQAKKQREERRLDVQQRRAESPKRATAPRVTHEELLAAAAASLKKYGTLVPPREALLTEMPRQCPHCKEWKPIATGFGLRNTPSGLRSQTWCRDCKNSKDGHPTRFGLKS